MGRCATQREFLQVEAIAGVRGSFQLRHQKRGGGVLGCRQLSCEPPDPRPDTLPTRATSIIDSGEEMRLKDWVQRSEMVALRRVVVTIARSGADL